MRSIVSVIFVLLISLISCEKTGNDGEPCRLSVSVSAHKVTKQSTDNQLVEGGSCTALPKNGTPPFSFNWSNGGTSKTITNLSEGTYSVTVTDANGCQASGKAKVTCCDYIYPPTF